MLTLVLVYCLSGAPDKCRQEHPYIPELTMSQCQIMAQQLAPQFIHEDEVFKGWKCVIENNPGKAA